jgi:hypothetical protein
MLYTGHMPEHASETPVEFTELVERFAALPEPDRFVKAYEYVRDLAYGDIGSRNPFDVLAQKKGTCSGKHALLKMLLAELGYEVQSFFALHDFGKFPISPWPDELKEFERKVIPDYHDFLKITIGGEQLMIDGVFDKELVRLGFPSLEWDGKTNMQLPIEASDIFPAKGDMEDHKKHLIAGLPQEEQELRKQFLTKLTTWLDSKR